MKRNTIVLLLLAAIGSNARANSLPPLAIQKSKATVSGLSSGATFAHQMLIANSSRIQGVGSFAGTAFGCGEAGINASKDCLKNPDEVSSLRLALRAKQLATAKNIDDLNNLSQAKAFLFQGSRDSLVHQASIELISSFYMHLLSTPPTFKMRVDGRAEHGLPTKDHGSDCGTIGPTLLENCGYDGVGEMLAFLYPGLKPTKPALADNLITFDQTEFADNTSGMALTGNAYIPSNCRKGGCRLHIALHGCRQNPEFVNDAFTSHTSYNAWAEANDLVVLYPAIHSSGNNPDACWDWWGYTGKEFLTREGKQISAVVKMIQRLEATLR